MNYGIISDIHGNIDALEKVLEVFKKRNVEKIICCGDIIGIGPCPEESVQRLMKYKENIISVRGNHEQYFLNGIPQKIHDDNRPIREEELKNHKWTQKNLSTSSKVFLENLPVEQVIETENKKIYVTHYPLDENEKYAKHIKKATPDEIQDLFKTKQADVYLYGHTHKENINKIDGKMYINPGSLGCPGTSSIAKCGILTIEKDNINYEPLDIHYDSQNVVQKIKDIKYPLYKKILMLFYGINDELVQMLGELVTVEKIQKTSTKDLYYGDVYYNNEEIKSYVIGNCVSNKFYGKIVGIIELNNEKKLVVAEINNNLEYAKIKEYFQDIEEIKDAKFKCLKEKSAGAVIYKHIARGLEHLIIYNKKDIAGFPKGHIEVGETEEQAAKREIFEEVGVKVELKPDFREKISYYVDDTPIQKEVVFFLAEIPNNSEIHTDEKEINRYQFMSFEEAQKVLMPNVKEILKKAQKFEK